MPDEPIFTLDHVLSRGVEAIVQDERRVTEAARADAATLRRILHNIRDLSRVERGLTSEHFLERVRGQILVFESYEADQD
jgi:hypothetical protein